MIPFVDSILALQAFNMIIHKVNEFTPDKGMWQVEIMGTMLTSEHTLSRVPVLQGGTICNSNLCTRYRSTEIRKRMDMSNHMKTKVKIQTALIYLGVYIILSVQLSLFSKPTIRNKSKFLKFFLFKVFQLRTGLHPSSFAICLLLPPYGRCPASDNVTKILIRNPSIQVM